jgi:hypothetical protein
MNLYHLYGLKKKLGDSAPLRETLKHKLHFELLYLFSLAKAQRRKENLKTKLGDSAPLRETLISLHILYG